MRSILIREPLLGNAVVDLNDRELRNVVIGLGGRTDGVPT